MYRRNRLKKEWPIKSLRGSYSSPLVSPQLGSAGCMVGSALTGAAVGGLGRVLAAVVFAFGLPRFSSDLDRLTFKRPGFFLGLRLGGAGITAIANCCSFSTFL